MKTPVPASDEPAHDPGEATRWFSQWHIYRSIVDADWMAHRGIFSAVRAWMLLREPRPATLLDLGCGDAGFVRGTFDDVGLRAYTGVDASAAALAKARAELDGAQFRVELCEADLLACLRDDTGSAATDCDLILASYAVHHLPAREKQEFFRLAQERLAPDGCLLFADVFRRPGETRAQYMENYVGMMRQGWTGMTADALASTIEHITSHDFPEDADTICGMAFEAGFRQDPRELFRDATGFHRLLAFAKTSGTASTKTPKTWLSNDAVPDRPS